jgi:hypothetical protein
MTNHTEKLSILHTMLMHFTEQTTNFNQIIGPKEKHKSICHGLTFKNDLTLMMT